MFIAHLPAGYLATHFLAGEKQNRQSLVAVGLTCSALPDFDLLWFYLVDDRQTAHHEYIFHWPLFWLSIALIAWIVVRLSNRRALGPYILVGLTCLLLHMFLDSFAAEIYWLRPFSDWHLNLVEVPAGFGWWVLNFVFHWTFAAEILICLAAGFVWWRRKSLRPSST